MKVIKNNMREKKPLRMTLYCLKALLTTKDINFMTNCIKIINMKLYELKPKIGDDFEALACKRRLQFPGCLAASGFLCGKVGKFNADSGIFSIKYRALESQNLSTYSTCRL